MSLGTPSRPRTRSDQSAIRAIAERDHPRELSQVVDQRGERIEGVDQIEQRTPHRRPAGSARGAACHASGHAKGWGVGRRSDRCRRRPGGSTYRKDRRRVRPMSPSNSRSLREGNGISASGRGPARRQLVRRDASSTDSLRRRAEASHENRGRLREGCPSQGGASVRDRGRDRQSSRPSRPPRPTRRGRRPCPTTSGCEELFAATTAAPHCIASRIGSPNPS